MCQGLGQGHMHAERLRCNHRTMECFPFPTPHHLTTLTLYMMSTIEQKMTEHTIRKKKQFGETGQASESRLRYGRGVGMIRLGIIAVMNMLRTLMGKSRQHKEQMGNVSTEVEILSKNPRRNL